MYISVSAETNAILVVLVKGVHGILPRDEIPGAYARGRRSDRALQGVGDIKEWVRRDVDLLAE
jgi:hypothetical protein